MKLNFEGREMQKWNTATDRAQKVEEKNGVICLIIMFTSGAFQMHLNIFPKLSLMFCCNQQNICDI